MATTSKTRQAMSDEDLGTLMGLINDADSVELKLTVPEADHRSTVVALGADALDSQIRQVIFFDTPDLTLQQNGLVVRARRVQRKGDDSVVKLRPVVPKELPPEVRMSDSFGVEVDALPGGFVCSGSMKVALATGSVRAVMVGDQPIRKLFSKEQRRFYKAHAPEGLDLDDLSVLGPIFVLKLKFTPEGFSRPLVGEMRLYPDGSRLLELSTKCPPSEAFQVAAEGRIFLAGKGVNLFGEQQTKTRKALDFFAKHLQAEAEAKTEA